MDTTLHALLQDLSLPVRQADMTSLGRLHQRWRALAANVSVAVGSDPTDGVVPATTYDGHIATTDMIGHLGKTPSAWNGASSPLQQTLTALDRLRTVAVPANAVITLMEAVAEASALALEQHGGARGPLHGMPVAVKDNIDTSGVCTTVGSRILADRMPDRDATVVNLLHEAGAVIVAKTNMDEFAWGANGTNAHYGDMVHPLDSARFISGSSGGSALAVALGCVPAALGTDTGGSIRLPAATLGVVGLRPTMGAVSNRGVFPLAWSLDTVGPIADSVASAAAVHDVLAVHDPNDPQSARCPSARIAPRSIEGLRIGLPESFLRGCQPAVRLCVVEVAAALRAAGAIVVSTELDLAGTTNAQLTIEASEPAALHHRWIRERPADYDPVVLQLLQAGAMITAADYLQAQRFRRRFSRQVADLMEDVDILLGPTLPFTAQPVGTSTVDLGSGEAETLLDAIVRYTAVASLAGLPALTVPAGHDPDGLPIGVQLIGRPFEEGYLFTVGTAIEQLR